MDKEARAEKTERMKVRGKKRKIRTLVRLALLPKLTGSLDCRFGAVLLEILIRHDFTANELVLEVGARDVQACQSASKGVTDDQREWGEKRV